MNISILSVAGVLRLFNVTYVNSIINNKITRMTKSVIPVITPPSEVCVVEPLPMCVGASRAVLGDIVGVVEAVVVLGSWSL